LIGFNDDAMHLFVAADEILSHRFVSHVVAGVNNVVRIDPKIAITDWVSPGE
jgi:hypothetical protein